jgi:hypothetical protein
MRMHLAAAVIQRSFRSYVKRLVYWRAEQAAQQQAAAVTIQRIWRGAHARTLAKVELGRLKHFARLGAQAVVVQTAYRGYVARRREGRVVRAINDLYVQRRQEVASAAVVYIQALGRAHLARRQYAALCELTAQRELDVQAAAPPIQRAFRCYRARVELERRRQHKREVEARAQAAVKVIQNAWKAMLRLRGRRKSMWKSRLQKEKEEKGAKGLQAAFRGYRTRKSQRRRLRAKAIKEKGAGILQKMWRGTRVMKWEHMRANKLATEVWDRQDMETELAARRVVQLRPKLLAAIRVAERDSDEEDEEDGEVDKWEECWDEARQVPYWHNPATGECSDDMPVSRHAVQLSLVGKQLKVFWPAEARWFPGVAVRYNRSKGRHRVEYDDGDHEWVDLLAERDRVQVLEQDVWIMLQYYVPPDVREVHARRRERHRREHALDKARREDAEWVPLADDEQVWACMCVCVCVCVCVHI